MYKMIFWRLVLSPEFSSVQFSINMFIIYDKGELNIILSSMIFASTVSSHSYCTAKINLFKKKEFLILSVIWLVPSITPLHHTPTLALLSGGEPVAVATTAAVHKRPAFPWARVEVPQQNIVWTDPLWHRLQAAVYCRNCMRGENNKYVWGVGTLTYCVPAWLSLKKATSVQNAWCSYD